MLNNDLSLNPVDIPVALRLLLGPAPSFQELSADLGISTSTAHTAVRRLRFAGLLHAEGRSVNWLALREFLAHGLRYAFPARPEGWVRGVATAHSAPPLSDHIISGEAIVWPAASGPVVGQGIPPLYPQAVSLPERNRSLYELLALTDALRVGRARERGRALEEIEARVRKAAQAA